MRRRWREGMLAPPSMGSTARLPRGAPGAPRQWPAGLLAPTSTANAVALLDLTAAEPVPPPAEQVVTPAQRVIAPAETVAAADQVAQAPPGGSHSLRSELSQDSSAEVDQVLPKAEETSPAASRRSSSKTSSSACDEGADDGPAELPLSDFTASDYTETHDDDDEDEDSGCSRSDLSGDAEQICGALSAPRGPPPPGGPSPPGRPSPPGGLSPPGGPSGGSVVIHVHNPSVVNFITNSDVWISSARLDM